MCDDEEVASTLRGGPCQRPARNGAYVSCRTQRAMPAPFSWACCPAVIPSAPQAPRQPASTASPSAPSTCTEVRRHRRQPRHRRVVCRLQDRFRRRCLGNHSVNPAGDLDPARVTGFSFVTDNTYDIGQSATVKRPRNIYAGTDVAAGGKVRATGGIGVRNSAPATTPGAVVRKMEVFDASGASLGFVPIDNTII